MKRHISWRLAAYGLSLVVTAAFILITSACGSAQPLSTQPSAPDSATQPDAAVWEGTMQEALNDLAVLPAPENLSSEDFQALKRALLQALLASGVRAISAVPLSPASAVNDLTAWANEDSSAQLCWTYRNQGDYDQNSEVNISDLTAVGIHLSKTDAWPFWNAARAADGDANNEVNIADVTPIGQWLGCKVENYVIEASDTGAAPWEEVDQVAFSSGVVPDMGGLCRFSYKLESPVLDRYYRVVPVNGSNIGVAASPVQYTGELAPTYTVAGVIEEYGSPIPNIAVTLSVSDPNGYTVDPLYTGADGSYSISDLSDGITATLTPDADGLVFLPLQLGVTIEGADIDNADFTAFAPEELQADLPAEAVQNSLISFELRIVDDADTTLPNFNTIASLDSDPAGMTVVEAPEFVDGVAQASIRFEDVGQYTVSINGLGESLDGELGTTEISAATTPEIAIAKWQGGADTAISLTFDDGTTDHWERGLPMWDDYGWDVTLGILSQRFYGNDDRIPQLQQAFDAGHELANHTYTHPDLTTLTEEQRREELQFTNDFLIYWVEGLDRVDTLIYPYETFNDAVISQAQSMGFLFARSGSQGISEYAQLNDAYDPPFMHLYAWANLNMIAVSIWDSVTDWAVTTGDWLVEECHGIGTEGETGVGWSPRPEYEFRAHYDHMASYGSQLWVAPVSTVGRYIMERNAAQLTTISSGGSELSFTLTHSLDPTVFDVPVTVSVSMPATWTSATVTQAGTPLTFTASDNRDQININVMPNGGTVVVSWL